MFCLHFERRLALCRADARIGAVLPYLPIVREDEVLLLRQLGGSVVVKAVMGFGDAAVLVLHAADAAIE